MNRPAIQESHVNEARETLMRTQKGRGIMLSQNLPTGEFVSDILGSATEYERAFLWFEAATVEFEKACEIFCRIPIPAIAYAPTNQDYWFISEWNARIRNAFMFHSRHNPGAETIDALRELTAELRQATVRMENRTEEVRADAERQRSEYLIGLRYG